MVLVSCHSVYMPCMKHRRQHSPPWFIQSIDDAMTRRAKQQEGSVSYKRAKKEKKKNKKKAVFDPAEMKY